MMKKLLTILAIVFSLLACDNDESVKSLNFEDSAFGVVGRWYVEKTDNPELDMFAEYTFTTDGEVYVDEYRRINGYKRNEGRGSYSIDGNRIVSNMESNKGLPIQNGSDLLSLNSLTFKTRNKDYGDMQFLRIIGIVTMYVGDTLRLDIQQAVDSYTSQTAEVISCSTIDNAIASIDNTGLLTAKLIGVTYLNVETSIGNAILKISVSDNQNLWNDFSLGLGKDFDEIEKIFGKHYAFRSDSIRYFCDNPYVDSVDIYRHGNFVDSIIVSFKDNTGDDIVSYLQKKQTFVKDTLSYSWYTDNANYLLSTYSAKYYKDGNKLIYTLLEIDWDDRRSDYGLTDKELEKKYGTSNGDSLGIINFDINVKNDFIIKISYALDRNSRRVYSYSALLNIDLPVEMIDDYINRKYAYYNYNDDYKHGKNIQIDGKEMILLVRRDRNRLRFMFIDNK